MDVFLAAEASDASNSDNEYAFMISVTPAPCCSQFHDLAGLIEQTTKNLLAVMWSSCCCGITTSAFHASSTASRLQGEICDG